MCGTSGIIAAVTEVHHLCDVKGCLAMNLQGSFLWVVMRTSIKFHVLLGGSALRVLQDIEGWFRDTCCFIWNYSLMSECH